MKKLEGLKVANIAQHSFKEIMKRNVESLLLQSIDVFSLQKIN